LKVKGNFASLEFYKQGNLLNYKEKFVKPFNVLEEVLSRSHPLDSAKHELQSHGFSHELALQRLGEPAVQTYLAQRFSGATLPSNFVQLVHQRTDGNPLFMVNVTDHLVERGVLGRQDGQWVLTREHAASEMGLPATLRQVIETQIARLSAPQQAILEVASVAGMEILYGDSRGRTRRRTRGD
jgi:predicted ATPase